MTAALEADEWSAARPGRTLPLGKTRYPLHRRLGGPQGRSGRAENLVPTDIIRLHILYSIPEDEHKMFETCRKEEDLN